MKLYKLYEQVLTESLISENSLYGKKIIDGVTKKIGDSSDDTLNKIAIAGLYRNVFGNIQQVKSKEQLDKVFDDWYNTTIEKMVKTSAFIDNKDLATKYLDAYVKNIKTLGNNARPFSFKKIESGLVDLVNNNGWIKDNSIKQANDIYNPKDDDIVYQDENVIILDTNTKAKCVMYGRGESWCITKPYLNYYNTYRIKYGATPYFVLQKNVKGNEHKLVIMHYQNGYAIADRSNSGDRAGSKSSAKPWSSVEQQIPNLKGLEKYFPYREITEDEKRYEEIIERTKDYKGDNLQGYIDNEIRGLVINGSQVTDEDFIRDYAALGVKISDNQLKSLRPEVLNSLIESDYFLTQGGNQTNILNPKQQLRVARIKIQNKKSLTGDEFLLLPEKERNNYISNLNSNSTRKLVKYSKDPDKIINILLSNKEVISNLDYVGIETLMSYSKDPDKIINILAEKANQYISNLNSDGMRSLITYSKEPNKIINILGEKANQYISNLNSDGIRSLLRYSKEPDKIINVLLSNKELMSNLDYVGIYNLVQYSKEPEKVFKLLGDKGKQFISNLDSDGIKLLLQYSKARDKIVNVLLSNKEFVSNLDKDGFVNMIIYSGSDETKEKISNVFKRKQKN
jgi:hypothetical protein